MGELMPIFSNLHSWGEDNEIYKKHWSLFYCLRHNKYDHTISF